MASQTLPREPSVRFVGGAVVVVGVAALLCYPLVPPPRGRTGIPEPITGMPLFASQVLGPPLLVWGTFAFRDRTLRPLSVWRALAVPVLAILTTAAGFARFLLAWERDEPYHTPLADYGTDGPRMIYRSPLDLFEWILGFEFFVVLAGISAIVVGTALARRGRRAAAASGLLPIGITLLSLLLHEHLATWDRFLFGEELVVITVAIGCVGVTVGYFAAAPTDPT